MMQWRFCVKRCKNLGKRVALRRAMPSFVAFFLQADQTGRGQMLGSNTTRIFHVAASRTSSTSRPTVVAGAYTSCSQYLSTPSATNLPPSSPVRSQFNDEYEFNDLYHKQHHDRERTSVQIERENIREDVVHSRFRHGSESDHQFRYGYYRPSNGWTRFRSRYTRSNLAQNTDPKIVSR